MSRAGRGAARPGWHVRVLGASCGKKGPPLPPLVLLPAAPGDLRADRRGTVVDVQFVLPSANTDGSRPANVERVDVYALNGPGRCRTTRWSRRARASASVAVKAPRDPNETIDADDPDSDLEPLEGPGSIRAPWRMCVSCCRRPR